MEKSFTMPKLGATMTEGTVLHWLYQPGDRVAKGEPLVEIMTDKVNLEVEAPIDGLLLKVLAQEGDILPVGTTLAILTDDASSAKQKVVAETQELRHAMPVASTPAAKREAALHGIDLHAIVNAGASPPINRNDVLTFVSQAGQLKTSAPLMRQDVRATPLAQKIAREHQIDLARIAERRPGEKVTRADVESHLQEAVQPVPTHEHMLLPTPQVAAQNGADEELVPLTPVRQIIGKRMQQSITSAPHIYLDLEIDMTEAERCRQSIRRNLQVQGEQAPSLTALIVRATASALVLHPNVNAVFEVGTLQGKDAIRHRRAVHIGVAVDTERALVTPVIRNAHQLALPDIARELRRLTLAAHKETLTPEEVIGATFTISNLGMYDIDTFHAIIVPGQSAILAVGKVTKRGVVREDSNGARLEIRPVMKVSLSADHRILDGANGGHFLHQLKLFLEEPYLLL
ncbi:MAG: pyruvate dehydrogenase complex dihydrolipoamide acetyltransferase [Ktedonobacteraceae bacterium]